MSWMKVWVCLVALTFALPSTLARAERPSDIARALETGVILDVPWLQQVGEKNNCGPTAATMLLGAHLPGSSDKSLRELRDRIGDWSWKVYPLRRLRLPGNDAGMTTAKMVHAILDRFGEDIEFERLSHPWLPQSAYALPALKLALAAGRPVIVLVQAATIWGTNDLGLHWVVVRGFRDGKILFSDPADRSLGEISEVRFREAWNIVVIEKIRNKVLTE